jgi:radical SAM superfamily enzyme YgiQ (UPF0313 family)
VPDILLSTLNAKYIHAAFGLRCLMANMAELRPRTAVAEFDINQRPLDIAETILAANPRILGLGVYVWNVGPTTELVAILKRLRPDLLIVLGGPEVSYECDAQEIVRLADHVITGEADLAFAQLCRTLLSEPAPADAPATVETSKPFKIIPAPLPELGKLAQPYELYDDKDVAHRVIYVEASRGCPFTCEFCLSSLEIPVRQFPLEEFLAAMDRLLQRGLRQFKFVDRTFNLHLATSRRILGFFLERWTPGLFVHFEMVPDRLPSELRELIAKFPPGALQFEVGIQTFEPEVEKLISRRQNHDRLADNFRWLRGHSGVHIHADLIAGLPGETLESFARGFDRLMELGPQEIQVGILKRLRGTPIIRHDREWAMKYNPVAPYEVLSTRTMDFGTLARLRRFAKFWDLYGNSGNFLESLPLLWREPAGAGSDETSGSPFAAILAFSDWLHGRSVKGHGIALPRQYELLWQWMTGELKRSPAETGTVLARDYRRPGRTDLPPWLIPWSGDAPRDTKAKTASRNSSAPRRQARHLTQAEAS